MMYTFTNISSVGIIFNAKNPTQIFIEVKQGHPIKLVNGQLCPIGGNWIGEKALKDRSPLETFRREICEEISFDRPQQTSLELSQMGMADDVCVFPTSPNPNTSPSKDDFFELANIKRIICDMAMPFGAYENIVTREALLGADPSCKINGFSTLAFYYLVPLGEDNWECLLMLQNKFGNLSNEAITVVTSLPEIITSQTCFAFGHDLAFRDFWKFFGFESEAEKIPFVKEIESCYVARILNDYCQIRNKYLIEKYPQ